MTNQSDFSLELDHIVIFVTADAPEAKTVEMLGLQGFGGTTKHGDLGTASTAFFFQNTYLELFWVHDETQAAWLSQVVGLDLEARLRWRETGASPFSLALRRRAGFTGPLPFATRKFQASWMPGEIFLHFQADNSAEPAYSVIPAELTYPAFRAQISEQQHPLGVKQLTAVKLTIQSDEVSPTSRLLMTHHLVTLTLGSSPGMELTFDNGTQGKSADARPVLPLILHY